jgi:hypothetical protein
MECAYSERVDFKYFPALKILQHDEITKQTKKSKYLEMNE